jgi:RHS repeat-associated protein
MKTMKLFFKLFLVLILSLNHAWGAEVKFTQRLEGGSATSPLLPGQEILLTDGNFSSLGSFNFTDVRQHAYVRLGLSERSNLKYISGLMEVTVNVTITPYSNAGIALPAVTENLVIQYRSTDVGDVTVDAEDYRMNGVYMFRMRVNTISIRLNGSPSAMDVPNLVYLESGMEAERYYDFNDTYTPNAYVNHFDFSSAGVESPSFGVSGTFASTKEIEFAWIYVPGAEYYDLEWVWVDNYSTTDINTPLAPSAISMTELEFTSNATRIRTGQQNYRIPHVFSKGYLLYRVRGVGRWTEDPDKDKAGKWSGPAVAKVTAANWSIYTINHAHESLKNWQYQATYAEDGKRKDVVQYLDGSLRNRQTVTRMTSNMQSVVGETIYDNEGRAVVQMLPAPQDNPAVMYYRDFNKNTAANVPYNHLNFDWEIADAPCTVTAAEPVSLNTGAGKYYSPAAHQTETDWQQYVPDAGAYPFTQVEYTPDNTGRIRNQSGVGASHKIGSGKETFYYYLQPSQEELNRLFGYKVGYKSRYKKNMVVDANGQVSVSYLDAQGRVVATALSGSENTPLDPLASEQNQAVHLNMTTDLLNKSNPTDVNTSLDDNVLFSTGNFGALNDGLRLNTQIGVVEATDYTFTYEADFASYQEQCDADPESEVNFPYIFDLTLTLKDDCGNILMEETNHRMAATDFEAYVAHFEETHTVLQLKRGSYTLYKSVSVNQQAVQDYRLAYLNSALNNCVLSAEDFDLSEANDCYDTTCTGCLEDLGTAQEFAAGYAGLGISAAELTSMYNAAKAECDALCTIPTTCDAVYGMMLADVMPDGQYGNTDGVDPLSVYTIAGNLLEGNWKFPVGDYLDAAGAIALVEVVPVAGGGYFPPIDNTPGTLVLQANGNYTIHPEDLQEVSHFAERFSYSWAEALVTFHPEYKLYRHLEEICVTVNTVGNTSLSSEEYDAILSNNLSTAALAQTNGFSVNFMDAENRIMLADPFYQLTYPTLNSLGGQNFNTIKANLLNEALNNFKNSGMNLLRYSIKTAIYGNNYVISPLTIPATWLAFNNAGYTVAQKDAIWQAYSSNYISFKAQVKQLMLDVYGFTQTYTPATGTPGHIFNGPIGPNGLNLSFVSTFSYSASQPAIMSGVFSTWGAPTFSVLPTVFTDWHYDNKQARFVRIDNLYNAGTPATATLEETAATADYAAWQQTGLCPLTLDVERLLSALASRNLLKSNTNNSVLPELVPDLFLAIRGTYPAVNSTMDVAGTTGSIYSTTDLTLTFSGSPAYSLILPQVSASLPWSTYGSAWSVFSISGSYPLTGTTVKILVKAGVTELTAQEYVITYTSNAINLDACEAAYTSSTAPDPDCGKEEAFEASLLSLLQKLKTANALNSTYASVNTLPGYTYGSIMTTHLGTNASWNGATAVLTGANGMKFNFGFAMPASTAQALFTSVNIVGNQLYAQYMNSATGVFTPVSGTYSYNDTKKEIPLQLECGCEQSSLYATNVATHINQLLALPEIPKSYVPANTTFVTQQSTADKGFLYTASLGYETQKGYTGAETVLTLSMDRTLAPALSFSIPAGQGIQDINYVEDLVFKGLEEGYFTNNGENKQMFHAVGDEQLFDFTAVLFNGRKVHGTGKVVAFYSAKAAPPCKDCDPTPLVPVSCNAAYLSYQTAMDAKFRTPLSQEDVQIYVQEYLSTESNFCNNGYAHIVGAYINYINRAQVVNLQHPYYLSISEFGATQIGYSEVNLLAAVNYYFATYLPANPTSPLSWNNYVKEVFLKLSGNANLCPPVAPPTDLSDISVLFDPCMTENHIDIVNGQNQYEIYLDQLGDAFEQAYVEGAISTIREKLTEVHRSKEYHYTLYYYDRAGNLIETVPPNGVKRFEYDAFNAPANAQTPTHATINAMRAQNALQTPGSLTVADYPAGPAPAHEMTTNYKYNSLNQLISQTTPDGGNSSFAYDGLGRIAASQNAEQNSRTAFSYTYYDGLGRVAEAGEFVSNQVRIYKGKLMYLTAGEVNVRLTNWVTSITPVVTARREVTRTFYDDLGTVTTPLAGTAVVTVRSLFGPQYASLNTRNRIVGVIYQAVYNTSSSNYDNGSFYDYDVHGNVTHLIQINRDQNLIALNQHIKHLEYTYDLVSGNVQQVAYQEGEQDQFFHRYGYDADNRITKALTSSDGSVFEEDAKYFYYDHGPLARTETGDKKVQAQDYAYTIQGWLKSVNGEKMDVNTMMGQDGKAATINSMVAKDAFGYSLSYFTGDYNAYNKSMLNFSEHALIGTQLGNSLYNGNIRTMLTAVSDRNEALAGGYTHQTKYSYDQLNRITSMLGFKAITPGALPDDSKYSSSYAYDPNGNLTLRVNNAPNTLGNAMMIDALDYKYETGKNRLAYVDDPAASAPEFTTDIEDQGPGNYVYDDAGRLIKDALADIATIEWTVTNKVKKVIYDAPYVGKVIEFTYNAMGHRISKQVTEVGGEVTTTYYVLDAQGVAMSTYERRRAVPTDPYKLYLAERNLYGSSRIGIENPDLEMSIAANYLNLYPLRQISAAQLCTTTGAWYHETVGTTAAVTNLTDDGYDEITFSNANASTNVMSNSISAHVVPGTSYVLEFDYLAKTNVSSLYYEVSDCNSGTILASFSTNVLGHKALSVPVPGTASNVVRIRLRSTETSSANMDFTISKVVLQGQGSGFEDLPYLPLSPIVTIPVDPLCSTTGQWYNEIPNTASAIVNVNSDGYEDIAFTNTNTTYNVMSTQIGAHVVPGATYTLEFDVLAKTNISNLSFEVRDCNVGTFYVNTPANSLGHVSHTFTVPANGSDRIRIKWLAEETSSASMGFTLSKILLQGPGQEFDVQAPVSYRKVEQRIGDKRYELANHLGNVLNVVTDRKLPLAAGVSPNQTVGSYTADVVSYSDYYAFGMQLPGRNGNTPAYRYGFNGMEKDDEIKSVEGSSYDFGARMYDPRLGRWLSGDKKIQQERSPYAAMNNNPILLKDPDGNDIIVGSWKKEDLDKFIGELIGITGLAIYVDENNRLQIDPTINVPVEPKSFKDVPISSIAAGALITAINDQCNDIVVNGKRGDGSYTITNFNQDTDQTTMNLDPGESEKFKEGFNNLTLIIDHQTKDIAGTTGIKFFHELSHGTSPWTLDEWAMGNPTNPDGTSDERSAGGVLVGSAVEFENAILREMGLKIRTTYSIRVGDYKIIPYTRTTQDAAKILRSFKSAGSVDRFLKSAAYTKIKMTTEQIKEDTDRDYEANPEPKNNANGN